MVTSFLQDKTALERGLFDKDNTLPEELTQLRMGKIVRERYPDLSDEDQEAIRQHAIAAMNITQQAKLMLAAADAGASEDGSSSAGSTALIDGVRKFVNVRDLDIDLIDRINPFDAAYAVLAKAMDEKSLSQVQASIAAKKVSIPEDEARDLAMRALQFKTSVAACQTSTPPMPGKNAWQKAWLRSHAIGRKPRRRKWSKAMAELDDDELLEALGVEVAPIKTRAVPRARNGSLRALKTFCAFTKPMAMHRSMGKAKTFLSACMPCG